MLLIFLLFSLILLGNAQFPSNNLDQQFSSFKTTYGKTYSNPAEEEYRKSIFSNTLNSILAFNNNPNSSYKQGINKYSDKTNDEIRQYTLRGITNLDGLSQKFGERISAEKLYPDKNFTRQSNENLDYRALGSVTAVKDQGLCSSSWAFSVAASLEGTQHKARRQLIGLSEQELVDCFGKSCGSSAISMQYTWEAIEYLVRNQRMARESCYSYTSGKTGNSGGCRTYSSNCTGATPLRKVSPIQADENDLKAHLNRSGPISATIYITNEWTRYKSGVFDDPNCKQNSQDDQNNHMVHAVAIVGYGVEDGKPFWLAKNSWSAGWGDRGYIKMARNKNSQCEIAHWTVYATV